MTSRRSLALFMWFIPLSFFAFQFVLRLWPSLMMQQTMQRFEVDATGFGFLASLYYYGYAGMQIPIAVLLDRVGLRLMLFVCALLCGLGTLAFAYTDSWGVACASRFLIGVGSAVGFLGTSKAISQWFPKSSYASMVGFSFSIGLMGAIYGGRPITMLVESHSAQNVAYALGCTSIVIALLAVVLLREPKQSSVEAETPLQWVDFKKLLSNPAIWFLAVGNLFMVGVLEGFADVWGVPYLIESYQYTKAEAAQLMSIIFVGMLFGGPFLAAMTKRFGTYPVISLCGLGMALCFLTLLFAGIHSYFILASLLFFIGVMCCYQVIVFAAGSELVGPKLLGVTVAFLNCINMLGGSFFHMAIGTMMDTFWQGDVIGIGTRHYSLESYTIALLIIPISALAGSFLVGFLGFRLRQNSMRLSVG